MLCLTQKYQYNLELMLPSQVARETDHLTMQELTLQQSVEQCVGLACFTCNVKPFEEILGHHSYYMVDIVIRETTNF
jgi:hypothetical protein